MTVYMRADRLDAPVARGQATEPGPCLVAEHVGQAVPAGQRIDQGVIGQGTGRGLGSILVRVLLGIRDDSHGLIPERRPARRKDGADARVPVKIVVSADRHVRLRQPPLVLNRHVRGRARLHLEDHRGVDLGHINESASYPDTSAQH
jgi:hypothetical protein